MGAPARKGYSRMKTLTIFFCLLLVSLVANAQVAPAVPLNITGLTAGNEVTDWESSLGSDSEDDPEPETSNYIYTDRTGTNVFFDGDIPTGWDGVQFIHTKEADADNASSTLVQFTTDIRAQICVWWPDVVTIEGWVATAGYVDSGRQTSLPESFASGYCAVKDAGSYDFGASGTYMYVISVAPARRTQPDITPPPVTDEGYIAFNSVTGLMDESTTSTTVAQFQRITSCDTAVSVDVTDALTGSCASGSDYTAITDTTFNWADTVCSTQALSITANAVSADCTIGLAFTNLTGGIEAHTERQTMTVTIEDIPPGPAGDPLFSENWESYCAGQGCEPTGSFWGSGIRTTIRDDFSVSSPNSLRFNFKSQDMGSEDGNSEQRFNMGTELTEFTLLYELYIPANYHHPSLGGPTNNKFLRMWLNAYGDTEKIGLSLRIGSGNTISDLQVMYRSSAGQGMSGQAREPFITNSDLGTWITVEIYIKAATDAADGVIRVKKDNSTIVNHALANNWVAGTQGWDQGYLFGWANSGFETQVWFNMDDFFLYEGEL